MTKNSTAQTFTASWKWNSAVISACEGRRVLRHMINLPLRESSGRLVF